MSLLKIMSGGSVMLLIMVFLPFVDIVELFVYIVIVPLVFLVAFGVMSHGTYEAIRDAPKVWRSTLNDLRERTAHYRESQPVGGRSAG